MFPPIGAWIHDGHGYIRWVEWRLRTELQNRPVNSLEGSMSVQESIADQIVAGTCIYICEALRDCFAFISMLKSRQVSVNLLRLVLGRNIKGNAVKMLL